MKQWFTANLGDAMLAAEELERVRSLFTLHVRNTTTAVLMRHENVGRLHCELVLYFPPELAELAERVGASPCGPPALTGLGVAIGSPRRLDDIAIED